jgi:CRISPR/Cas system CSM-associated protein Csm5 (group 7 of RAMP superfamily)
MTLDKARELIQVQLGFGGGYNRNAVRLILGEIQRDHGQDAVNALIRELGLEQAFGLEPGTDFSGVGR